MEEKTDSPNGSRQESLKSSEPSQKNMSLSMTDLRIPQRVSKLSISEEAKRSTNNVTQNMSMVVNIDPLIHAKSHTTDLKTNELSSIFCFIYASFLVIFTLLHSIIIIYKSVYPNTLLRTLFGIYIYSVAAFFYIYIEIDMILQKRKKREDRENNSNKKTDEIERNGIDYQTSPCYYEGENQVLDEENQNKSKSSRLKEIELEEKTDMKGYLKINSKCTVQKAPSHRNANELRFSDDVFICDIPEEDEEEVDEEEVEEETFIDLSRLGSIFSHHGSSFFLRIGSLLFGVGNMVYIVLELTSQFTTKSTCTSKYFWWELILMLVFVLLQMFVLFKNPNFTITKKGVFMHKFGYIHIITTNFCMWTNTLVSEIDIETKHLSYLNDTYGHQDHFNHSITVSPFCKSMRSAASYLFPFILEYCLLSISIVAVLYWSVKEEGKTTIEKGISNLFKINVFEKDSSEEEMNETTVSSDPENLFAKSHRGIFFGCLLLAFIIISIIYCQLDQPNPEILYSGVDIILTCILVGVSSLALHKLNSLAFIAKPKSIDDALMLIAMFGGLMYRFAFLLSAIYVLKERIYTSYTVEIMRIFQAILGCLHPICQVPSFVLHS